MSALLLPLLMMAAAAATASPASPAPLTGAPAVTAYELRLDLKADGSADVALALRLDVGADAVARVPFPWPELASARLAQAPASTSFALTSSGERSTLTLRLPDGTRGSTDIRLEGRVTDLLAGGTSGARSLRVALMNLEPEPLHNLSLLVTFPESLRAHAIREALPKAGKADTAPRAALQAVDGRPGVRLHANALPQGDTTALRVDLTPAGRSPGWLIVGLALSLLYLRSFRDLVSPPKK